MQLTRTLERRVFATSSFVGVSIGLMPSTSEFFAIILSLLGLSLAIKDFGSLRRIDFTSFFPVFLYLVFNAFSNFLHDGFAPGALTGSYLSQIFGAVFLFYLFIAFPFDKNILVMGACVGIVGSVLIHGITYLPADGRFNCRSGALSGNAQWISAFLIVAFSAIWLSWFRGTFRRSWIVGGLIFLILFSTIVFSGGRMAFYIFMIFLTFGFFKLMLSGLYRKSFFHASVVVISVLVSFLAESYTKCEFYSRVRGQILFFPQVISLMVREDSSVSGELGVSGGEVGRGIENTDQNQTENFIKQEDLEVVVTSGGSRVEIWKNAVDAISASPIYGYGQMAEREIASRDFKYFEDFIHVHNQFLSWLIWSGIFGLISGLIFIFGLSFSKGRLEDGLIFGFILVGIFSSETLLLPFNLNVIIVLYGFFWVLSNPRSMYVIES